MIHNFGVAGRVVSLVVGVMLLGLFGALPSPWRPRPSGRPARKPDNSH
jgi:hypothetical protein